MQRKIWKRLEIGIIFLEKKLEILNLQNGQKKNDIIMKYKMILFYIFENYFDFHLNYSNK